MFGKEAFNTAPKAICIPNCLFKISDKTVGISVSPTLAATIGSMAFWPSV